MVACMLRIFAAAATPWAWLPDENATTPPLRSSCGIEDSLLKAPRNLNEPVRCSISGFRKTLVPTRSLRTGNDNSGVRTANGATTRAAASISAAPTAAIGAGSVMPALYRVAGRRGQDAVQVKSGGEMRVFRHKFDRLVFGLHGADIQGMFDKDPRRGLPGMAGGEFDAGLRRDLQRVEAGRAQILVQDADRRRADHVAGTR